MIRMKLLLAALVATLAVAAVPSAHACAATGGTVAVPCVHYVAAGSSAMFQQFAVAVVNDIAPNTDAVKNHGGTIHHYTVKSTAGCSGNCVNLHDVRPGGDPDIAGTFWIAYVCAGATCTGSNYTDVWEYDQVDSTVGVRSFLAQPANQNVLAAALSTTAGLQLDLIHSSLFLSGATDAAPSHGCVAGHLTTCDDAQIPSDVFAAVANASVNTGMTDITPDDAFFATQRLFAPISACTGTSQWSCLGFGPGPIGANIVSSYSGSFATPAAFALPGGNDPITGTAVPTTDTVFSVGEEPVVFLANRTNAGQLGAIKTGVVPFYSNLVDNANSLLPTYKPSPIGQLFGGITCSGSSPAFGLGGAVPSGGDFAVNPVLREALSGTMNATEFSVFRTFGGNLANVLESEVGNSNTVVTTSQEANVNGVNLAKATAGGTPCTSGLGARFRAIGTGEEVGTAGGTGVGNLANNLGYTFFSFGNVSPYAGLGSFGYLTLDGVDPIFASYAGGDPGQPATTAGTTQGVLPGCSVEANGTPGGCLRGDVWAGGNYFPHLIDGTYRAWSLLRAVCDSASPTCTKSADPFGTEAIIVFVQDDVHGEACTGCHPANAVADFLPFSEDKSFGPTGTIFGDTGVVRSHYAFNSAVGISPNEYANTHTNPGFSLLPVSGLKPDLANGVGGNSPENGGDAGGCIIAIDNSGTEGGITSQVYPAVNTQHIKFNYSPATAVLGVCGPGVTPPAVVGGACDQSNTPASGAPGALQCGLNSTCNPPAQGMSLAVAGESNNQFNGVWQVTKIVIPGALKVKTPITLTGSFASTPGSELTVSTGCSQ